MGMAEDSAAASLGELRVVDEAESGLDCENADYDSAELDVCIREELIVPSACLNYGDSEGFYHKTYHIPLLCAVHAEAEASPHQQPAHHLPA